MTIDRQFTYKRIILSAPLNGNLFEPHSANIEQYSLKIDKEVQSLSQMFLDTAAIVNKAGSKVVKR